MNLEKYKILIVDDDDSILSLMSDYLLQEGYSVKTTNNPLEALKVVEDGSAKIILTDIKMPEMNGIDLLEKVKKINGLVQVIIMTGYGSLENTVRCLEQGANDYLLKPFKNLTEVKNVLDLTIEKLARWEKVITNIYAK
jgi:DNA-binding NtrC family response regulator